MLQADRRTNPYPHTWEIPAGVAIAVLLVGALGIQLGRGLASFFTGHGWAWPASRNLFSSLPGVLGGDPAAGLIGVTTGPSAAAVTGWIVTVEVLLLATATAAAICALRRWGPGRMKGMATAAEAETILGLTRLRKVARVVRPDLYGAAKRAKEGGHDGYDA